MLTLILKIGRNDVFSKWQASKPQDTLNLIRSTSDNLGIFKK